MSITLLGRQSLIYGFGHFLSRFINFLLLPLYTYRLSPEEYGVISLIYVFIAFLNIIFAHGMDISFMRFQTLEKMQMDKKTIFSTSFIWIFFSTVLFASILYLFQEGIAVYTVGGQYLELIQLSIAILVFDTLIILPKVLFRLENKPYRFIYLELMHVIIILGLNIWWIGFLQLDIKYIFISNLIASGLSFLFVLPKIIQSIDLCFDLSLWKRLFIYSLPYIPAGIASIFNELIDRYMIKWIVNENAVGLYSASYRLGIFMLIIVMAFKLSWQPYYLKEGKKKESHQLFSQVGTYFLFITTYIWLFFTFFIQQIIQISFNGQYFINKIYWDSISIVPIVMLAYIILGVYLIQLPGIYIKNKNYWIPILNIFGAVVNILLNLILIPNYGYKSAAFATLIGYGIMVVLQYFVIIRFYPLYWEWKKIFKIIVISGVLFVSWKWSGSIWYIGFINLILYPILLWAFRFFISREKQYL